MINSPTLSVLPTVPKVTKAPAAPAATGAQQSFGSAFEVANQAAQNKAPKEHKSVEKNQSNQEIEQSGSGQSQTASEVSTREQNQSAVRRDEAAKQSASDETSETVVDRETGEEAATDKAKVSAADTETKAEEGTLGQGNGKALQADGQSIAADRAVTTPSLNSSQVTETETVNESLESVADESSESDLVMASDDTLLNDEALLDNTAPANAAETQEQTEVSDNISSDAELAQGADKILNGSVATQNSANKVAMEASAEGGDDSEKIAEELESIAVTINGERGASQNTSVEANNKANAATEAPNTDQEVAPDAIQDTAKEASNTVQEVAPNAIQDTAKEASNAIQEVAPNAIQNTVKEVSNTIQETSNVTQEAVNSTAALSEQNITTPHIDAVSLTESRPLDLVVQGAVDVEEVSKTDLKASDNLRWVMEQMSNKAERGALSNALNQAPVDDAPLVESDLLDSFTDGELTLESGKIELPKDVSDMLGGKKTLDQLMANLGSQLQPAAAQTQSAMNVLQSNPASARPEGATAQLTMQSLPNAVTFPSEMAAKVSWIAKEGFKTAHIQLDPPELGSLAVKISVDQDSNAHVSFVASSAQAKDALEGQMQRLREMLQHQGVELDSVDVEVSQGNGQAFGSSQSGDEAGQGGSGSGLGSGEELLEGSELENVAYVSPAEQGIDYYA